MLLYSIIYHYQAIVVVFAQLPHQFASKLPWCVALLRPFQVLRLIDYHRSLAASFCFPLQTQLQLEVDLEEPRQVTSQLLNVRQLEDLHLIRSFRFASSNFVTIGEHNQSQLLLAQKPLSTQHLLSIEVLQVLMPSFHEEILKSSSNRHIIALISPQLFVRRENLVFRSLHQNVYLLEQSLNKAKRSHSNCQSLME